MLKTALPPCLLIFTLLIGPATASEFQPGESAARPIKIRLLALEKRISSLERGMNAAGLSPAGKEALNKRHSALMLEREQLQVELQEIERHSLNPLINYSAAASAAK